MKLGQIQFNLYRVFMLNGESFVKSAFLYLLLRAPDHEGLMFYLAKLQRGVSKWQILSDIARSKEAKFIRPNTNQNIARAINSMRLMHTFKLQGLLQSKFEKALQEYATLIDRNHFFEYDFYAKEYSLVLSKPELLMHFVREGEALGHVPSVGFFVKNYWLKNYDVFECGVAPVYHFLTSGMLEGRSSATLPNIQGGLHITKLPSLRRRWAKKSKVAVVLHLYYEDLWEYFAERLQNLANFDLYVSLVVKENNDFDRVRAVIMKEYPEAHVFVFPNHGRDIFPFVSLLQSGLLDGYEAICKVHSKKSPHRVDGDMWRDDLMDGVLPKGKTNELVSKFLADKNLGILVADGHLYAGEEWWGSCEPGVQTLLSRLEIGPLSRGDLYFPAGSIYWMKGYYLDVLKGLQLTVDDFDTERAQLDGTLAHAFERILGAVSDELGLSIKQTNSFMSSKVASEFAVSKTLGLQKPFVSCFYLPQFYRTKENDEWWGDSYTEWVATIQAKPQFQGHSQPFLPSELGYYDLRVAETMGQQYKLARQHGVDSFCVYYYHFDDRKRLLEKPIDNLLKHPEIEFSFYLCWANESWTRNWDGLANDVLMPQTYQNGIEKEIAESTAQYFEDSRYYRLCNGAPRFVIYRPTDIPNLKSFVAGLRKEWSDLGYSLVNLGCVLFHLDAEMSQDSVELFDFVIEMPPHGLVTGNDWITSPESRSFIPTFPVFPGFRGGIYSYTALIQNSLSRKFPAYMEKKIIRGIMPSWDNTARRGKEAHICYGANPSRFKYWLRGILSLDNNMNEIMINAWNEWGEKAVMEPSQKYGRGYLNVLKDELLFSSDNQGAI